MVGKALIERGVARMQGHNRGGTVASVRGVEGGGGHVGTVHRQLCVSVAQGMPAGVWRVLAVVLVEGRGVEV